MSNVPRSVAVTALALALLGLILAEVSPAGAGTPTIVATSAGFNHTCALVADGTVKCWGDNSAGQLGDGTLTRRSDPVDVVGLSTSVEAISANGNHTCVLNFDGGVQCWGSNSLAQIGDGTFVDRTFPVDVERLTSGVIAIAAGAFHTCALTDQATVKCWGDNSFGQLGDGTFVGRKTPVDVQQLFSAVTAINAGGRHTCVRTTGGGVKCWGDNAFGQVGNGDAALEPSPTPVNVVGLSSGVSALAAAGRHTCALSTAGGVKCWGINMIGHLGDSTTGPPRPVPGDVLGLTSGVSSIAAGRFFTCAVTTAGSAKCWGRNDTSQLGDGSIINRASPVDVFGLSSGIASVAGGEGHACALTVSGGMRCWGSNVFGQLGDTTTVDRSTPVAVVAFDRAKVTDFNNDGKTDFGIYRPSTGAWYVALIGGGTIAASWGTTGDLSVPGDYNGDGKADFGIYRPTDGAWYVAFSGGGVTSASWGTTGDIPVPGDYNGDGKTDFGIYRPDSGAWYVAFSGGGTTSASWGITGDVAVPGDYNGDGTTDFGIYRPSNGAWYVAFSGGGTTSASWGITGDVSVPGDYNGDGRTDFGVYRPSNGFWYVAFSGGGTTSAGWGTSSDIPVPGDYNGDGRTDVGIYRPDSGAWDISFTGGGTTSASWGTAGDIPVPLPSAIRTATFS